MKYFNVIKDGKATVEDLINALFELEKKEDEIRGDLAECKGRILELQRNDFEGRGDKKKLNAEQIQAVDLEGKLDAIVKMQQELREKIHSRARRDREKRLVNLENEIKKSREKESAFNIEIVLAKAHLALLYWMTEGIRIEHPGHIDPSAREMFYNEVERLRSEFGLTNGTKSLKEARLMALEELNKTTSLVIDPAYVESLITEARSESQVAK